MATAQPDRRTRGRFRCPVRRETTLRDELECTDLGWPSASVLHRRYPVGAELLSENDEDLVDGYLHGLCGVFAIALRNGGGGELIAVRVSREQGPPRHIAVRMAQDIYADARGLELTRDQLVEGYGEPDTTFEIVPIDEEDVMRTFMRHPAFYRAAADDVFVIHPRLAAGSRL